MAKTSPAQKQPVSRKAPSKGSGRPAGLFTWIAIAVVVVVVATLVIVKVTSSPTSSGSGAFVPSNPTTVSDLTSVPASAFNAVGVTSTVVPVSAPVALKGAPALTGTTATGAKLPEVFYLGAEYCPFCAAERWPLIVALSRFGTFTGLGDMESSTLTGEVYPGTPTFTFVRSTYTSKYLVFKSIEQYTNVYDAAAGFYTKLQKPTGTEAANFQKYDTSKYIPGMQPTQDHSIPYISIGNKYLVSGSSFTPATLANQQRSDIAAGLSNATSPVSAAILATANYLSATFCSLTHDQPGSVCSSPGVAAAKKALGIK